MKPHRDRHHGSQPDDGERSRRREPAEGDRMDETGDMSAPGRTGTRRSAGGSRGRTSTRSRKKK